MKFIPKNHVGLVQVCVNDRYITVYDGNENSCLIFCNYDLTIIAMLTIPRSYFLTCSNNWVYLEPSRSGLMRFTPEVLIETYLFESFKISALTVDIETNLLYFHCSSDTIFVGNEQGKVLHQFSPGCAFDKIFVSCNNVILTRNTVSSYKCFLTLFNRDGKEITQITDQRFLFSNLRILHNKGIIVLATEDQIHFWRMV